MPSLSLRICRRAPLCIEQFEPENSFHPSRRAPHFAQQPQQQLFVGACATSRILRGYTQVHDGDLMKVRPHVDSHAYRSPGSFFDCEQRLHVVQVRHLNTQAMAICADFRRTKGSDRVGDAVGHAFLAGIEEDQRFQGLPLLWRDVRFEFDSIGHGPTERRIPRAIGGSSW
jgi:hypothetical protein